MERKGGTDESDWRRTGRAWDVEGSRASIGDPVALRHAIDALMDGHDDHPPSEHLTFDELRTLVLTGSSGVLGSNHVAKCRFCARMARWLASAKSR